MSAILRTAFSLMFSFALLGGCDPREEARDDMPRPAPEERTTQVSKVVVTSPGYRFTPPGPNGFVSLVGPDGDVGGGWSCACSDLDNPGTCVAEVGGNSLGCYADKDDAMHCRANCELNITIENPS